MTNCESEAKNWICLSLRLPPPLARRLKNKITLVQLQKMFENIQISGKSLLSSDCVKSLKIWYTNDHYRPNGAASRQKKKKQNIHPAHVSLNSLFKNLKPESHYITPPIISNIAKKNAWYFFKQTTNADCFGRLESLNLTSIPGRVSVFSFTHLIRRVTSKVFCKNRIFHKKKQKNGI